MALYLGGCRIWIWIWDVHGLPSQPAQAVPMPIYLTAEAPKQLPGGCWLLALQMPPGPHTCSVCAGGWVALQMAPGPHTGSVCCAGTSCTIKGCGSRSGSQWAYIWELVDLDLGTCGSRSYTCWTPCTTTCAGAGRCSNDDGPGLSQRVAE